MAARIWLALLGLLGATLLLAAPAQAAANPGSAALNWAEAHETGHWYAWGGTGPSYDCSGAVLAAFAHEGIGLPHNTVAMINSGKMVRVRYPRRGDLAFWGDPRYPSHVEFVTSWYHTSFGAQHTGTVVYWHRWNEYWAPSSFWRVE